MNTAAHIPTREPEIRRFTPSQDLLKSSVEILAERLTLELGAKLEHGKGLTDQLAAVRGPLRRLIHGDKQAHLASEARARMATDVRDVSSHANARPKGMFDIVLPVRAGASVVVPPYDVQWTDVRCAPPRNVNEPPAAQADRLDGSLSVEMAEGVGSMFTPQTVAPEFNLPGAACYVAAAVGVFLTTTQNMIATVSPYAPISCFYEGDQAYQDWPVFTEGGVGILIYKGTDAYIDRRASLWKFSSSGYPDWSWNRESFDTYIGNTLASDVPFLMEANVNYLVWVWCWTSEVFSGDKGTSWGKISCRIPFIVLHRLPV